MGVPKFFRYISERYPCLSELVRMHQVPDFDNLYLDMNGIVHNCTHPDDSKVNQKITEEMMFLAIFRYIEYLFQVIKPRKLFFLAIDGVAPRAKMNQQRSRRFRSAKEMETRENAARQKGEVIEEEFRFDSNCITPGTEFMVRLHKALQYFIQRQISTNESWQRCQVILSGHDTPGEGEHKIMDYIRYMKSQPGYDPNTTHCLYGLDADLIMLGCVTHEAHISLLREEVKFGKQNTKSNCVENTRFFLLHLGILKEYLELEFSAVRDQVPFGYDMEKIVDDWILMSFLVGNDFVPHLPNLHINNNALPLLYKAYMDVLPTLGGYMNENGILNLPRFQKFLERLELDDRNMFKEKNGETRYMGASEMDAFADDIEDLDPNDELAALVKASEQMVMDDILDGEETEESIFEKEFKMCRRDYYITKMHFPSDDRNFNIALRAEVGHYIRAIQWILHYYYRGVPSWSWYFPSHYAPYISDITNILEFAHDFELGKPFLPFQQLLGVLPPNSKDLLPVAYQDLMLNPKSELIDFYPANFETDMNGKKQDWEALVLIPFIDEAKLLTAMAKCENRLLDSERNRNKHGPMSVYRYSEENTGPLEGILKLPSLPNSYCTCTNVPLGEIHVAKNKLVFGRPKGALTDVHFPGFPTMKFLEYSGKLANLRVRVFEMASMNETMEVTVHHNVSESSKTLNEIYEELYEKEIFVGWPHLSHAKVVGVSDDKTYLGVSAATLHDHEVQKYSTYVKDIKDHHLKRMGIQLGPVRVLIHVNLVKSRDYALGHAGKLVLKTEWDNVKFVYPYQTIVRNLSIYNENFNLYKNVDEVYKKNTKVFLLSTKYYGCMGKVLDTSMLNETKRIQITIDVHAEPNLKQAMKLHMESKLAARNSYFNIYNACSQIGISKHALNRITGNFFVFSGKRRQINERAADKVNIGLQMRLPKDNKEIPGISKFMDNAWYLSADAIDIICQYLDKFPRMCEVLAKPDNNIFEDDFINDPELVPGTYLRELSKFVETLPHYKIRPRKMGTEYVDPGVAEAVEQAALKVKEEVAFKTIKLQTKLHLLFLPQTTIKCPDPSTTFSLFDRVIVATHNLSIPIGTKGTIVSIFSETDENPLKYENKDVTTYLYEVMFDDVIPNGDSYFGEIGYSKIQTVTEQSIINITYGRNLLNNRSDRAEATQDMSSENKARNMVPMPRNNHQRSEAAPRNNLGQTTGAPQKPTEKSMPTEDEKRAKDMLNNIWNSLKANPNVPPAPLPTSSATAVPSQGLDLTESLKKCLKIAPNSEGNKTSEAPAKVEQPVIQQPSPAQLPPPPANWRIEAQIQHLNQAKPTPKAPPQMPLMMMSAPHPHPNQMPRMPQMPQGYIVPMFPGGPQGPPIPPQMAFPPRGYNARGPMPMPPFRPVATMPFPRPHPFMNAPVQNRPFPPNQGRNNGKPFQNQFPNPQPEPNKVTGPNALRNTASVSGHGAFIPLQAARKITKLKNQNGGAGVQPEKAKPSAEPSTTTSSTAAQQKPEKEANVGKAKEKKEPKKVAVTPSKTQHSAPRPGRIAANFSVKEDSTFSCPLS